MTTKEKGTATIYRTDGTSEVLDHKPSLEECQKIVGGYVEIVHRTRFNPSFQGQMLVNEDGYPMGLPVNRKGTEIYGDPDFCIVGNILVLTGDWMLD